MKELNEMTIGRTDDPESPISVPAFEAAKLFGTGSRTPSGPADIMPRQQAGHMLAIDPPVRILFQTSYIRGTVHTCTLSRKRRQRAMLGDRTLLIPVARVRALR
jgi:hypothetical protein